MCKPLRSGVIPTTENVVRVTFAQQQERMQQEHIAHPEEQPQQQNVVNVNSSHNNITVNNHHSTTNLICIHPHGREDYSHITEMQWKRLVQLGTTDGGMKHVIPALQLC
jgi:hypothetical protein